jgi:hypothetical protein
MHGLYRNYLYGQLLAMAEIKNIHVYVMISTNNICRFPGTVPVYLANSLGIIFCYVSDLRIDICNRSTSILIHKLRKEYQIFQRLVLCFALYSISLINATIFKHTSGQSSWLQTQRSWVRFSVLPDFLSSSASGTG